MVGLTDAQAGKIAKHLKLQESGPSYEAVRRTKRMSPLLWSHCSACCAGLESSLVLGTYTMMVSQSLSQHHSTLSRSRSTLSAIVPALASGAFLGVQLPKCLFHLEASPCCRSRCFPCRKTWRALPDLLLFRLRHHCMRIAPF